MKNQPQIWKATDRKLIIYFGSEIGKLVMTNTVSRRKGVSLADWKKLVIRRLEFEGFKYHGLKA